MTIRKSAVRLGQPAVFVLSVLSSSFIGTAAIASTPLTFDDIFQAALQRSETVSSQEEVAHQAEELHTQAIGSVLPQVNAVGTYYKAGGLASTYLTGTSQTTPKLTATQPLFAAPALPTLRETELNVQSQQQAVKETKITLYQNVVNAFYQVIAAQRDIDDLNKESKMYIDWVKQLQAWVNIGRARPSDVTQIQASLYGLYATLEASKLTQIQAQESLSFYTGLPAHTAIQDPYPDIFFGEVMGDSLDTYRAKIEDRPDVKTFAYARDASDQAVTAAKYGHLPTASLGADYYLGGSGQTNEYQAGSWDITFTLTFPLYAGGTIQSKVRQAASLYRESELSLSQNERQADEQIRTYYNQLKLDHSQVVRLKEAMDYAWTNYLQEMHDFKLGLVTNIDVLTSMTTFEQAERSYDKERYQEKSDYLLFQSMIGKTKYSSIAF